MNDFKLEPIGIVHSPYTKKTKKNYPVREDIEAQVEVYPQFAEALFRISEFPELWIIFWFSEISDGERMTLKVHPRKDKNKPLRGVFCSRSPARPNPIGLTKVTLIKKEKNILYVKGLDAYDKTPVLDIKEV